MSTLSLQLYTIRDLLEQDLDQALEFVSGLGLDEVEPFGIEESSEVTSALKERGIAAGSAHARAVDAPERVIEAALELGCGTVFQPTWNDLSQWSSLEGVTEAAQLMNQLSKQFQEAGLRLGYHNHAFEFESKFEDRFAYEHFVSLLDPQVALEVDTYWAQFGGANVVQLLTELGERATHLHVKDGPANTHGDGGNVALGNGEMDLTPILAAAPAAVRVIEFDDCFSDLQAGIRESVAFLQGLS